MSQSELNHEADGSIWGRSAALGLDLYWVDGGLRFYDYERGRFLLNHEELKAQAAEAEGRANASKQDEG